jgi:hypothetical protein
MKKAFIPFLVAMFAIILVIVLVVVIYDEETGPPPPPKETTAKLHGIVVPIPDGWRAVVEGDVQIVYEPCSQPPCRHVAVYGPDSLLMSDWQTMLKHDYPCRSNPDESSGAITSRGTRMIGDRGAYYYTMARCGVSNIETLAIWYTQIPPRLIVTQNDVTSGLPDLEARLGRAQWTA